MPSTLFLIALDDIFLSDSSRHDGSISAESDNDVDATLFGELEEDVDSLSEFSLYPCTFCVL